MQKRLNFERPLECDFFSPRLGTVNKQNPSAIYLSGKCYITPSFNETDEIIYSSAIQPLERDLRTKIGECLGKIDDFKKPFIFNFELSESGLKFGKESYVSFQIFIKQKPGDIRDLMKIKKENEKDFVGLFQKMHDIFEENGFSVV